ncbi:MAG: LCP family protein [Candidatus Roizmanbacteria bacterium]|nr:LCP family protein [Candidatus Roizmanbacteria bacterium]
MYTSRTGNRLLSKTAIVLAICIGMLVYFVFSRVVKIYSKVYTSNTVTQVPLKKTEYSIALLGYGGGVHEGTFLTDSIMIVHVNTLEKSAQLISIPRDLWVKVPTKSKKPYYSKINSVYQMGLYTKNYPDVAFAPKVEQPGAQLVKRILSSVTGFSIDRYVAIDFDGFTKVVDLLGGIDVNVAVTFDDYEYPVDGKETDLCGKQPEDLPELEKIATESPELAFPCRYEHLHFDKGLTTMNGETALKFVRSRHSLQDGSDFGRSARQQLFMEAVAKKALAIGSVPKLLPLLDEVSNHVKTDIALTEMQKFGKEFFSMRDYSTQRVVLSLDNVLKDTYSDDGQYILVPRSGMNTWSGVHSFINKVVETPIVTSEIKSKK